MQDEAPNATRRGPNNRLLVGVAIACGVIATATIAVLATLLVTADSDRTSTTTTRATSPPAASAETSVPESFSTLAVPTTTAPTQERSSDDEAETQFLELMELFEFETREVMADFRIGLPQAIGESNLDLARREFDIASESAPISNSPESRRIACERLRTAHEELEIAIIVFGRFIDSYIAITQNLASELRDLPDGPTSDSRQRAAAVLRGIAEAETEVRASIPQSPTGLEIMSVRACSLPPVLGG